MSDKRLRTIKKAHQETGASMAFFRQLLREGKLTKYQINTAVYVSLVEFEQLATPTPVAPNISFVFVDPETGEETPIPGPQC